jgi:hypothetical protein
MKNPPANQDIDCSILAIRSSDDELRFFRYGVGITWLRVTVSCPLLPVDLMLGAQHHNGVDVQASPFPN